MNTTTPKLCPKCGGTGYVKLYQCCATAQGFRCECTRKERAEAKP